MKFLKLGRQGLSGLAGPFSRLVGRQPRPGGYVVESTGLGTARPGLPALCLLAL